MLSSVLHSDRAVQVNIAIMRAFVRLREALAANTDLAIEIDKMKHEQRKQSRQIRQVFSIIEQLIEPPEEPQPDPPKRRYGFPDRSQGKNQAR